MLLLMCDVADLCKAAKSSVAIADGALNTSAGLRTLLVLKERRLGSKSNALCWGLQNDLYTANRGATVYD